MLQGLPWKCMTAIPLLDREILHNRPKLQYHTNERIKLHSLLWYSAKTANPPISPAFFPFKKTSRPQLTAQTWWSDVFSLPLLLTIMFFLFFSPSHTDVKWRGLHFSSKNNLGNDLIFIPHEHVITANMWEESTPTNAPGLSPPMCASFIITQRVRTSPLNYPIHPKAQTGTPEKTEMT